ncbi:MAG: RagB/SusD family nutrient uptake outer membrane protein [Bacteroidota bacterium]
MKRINYILLLAVAFLISSCEPDMQPESEMTYNGFWDTEEAARAAHTGIYSSYRDYAYTMWQMGALRSDAWGGNTIESPSGIDLIENNISATNVPFGNWANFYGLLHYINDFIENAPDVPFQYEEDKQHMLGQVYGLRAQVYYTMLKAWGEVPITTEPTINVDLEKLKKPRAPKDEVLAQIKSDIAKSLEHFGDDNSLWNGKNVYWSKAATLALKGEVYLWSGRVLGGGESDYQEAKNALEQVSGFSLVDYSNLWGQENEFNDEFIFSFDYQQDQASNFYYFFTGRAVDFDNLYDSNGESVADIVVNGASRYGPSDKTLLMLDDQEDQRSNNFVKLYSTEEDHTPFEADDPDFKGSLLTKFLGIIGEDGTRKNYNNIPKYRYADVLLLLAEAKNNLGEDPTEEINLVRQRAYGDDYDPNVHGFVSGTQSENREAILDERHKEFIGEGKRWWDLVRAGDNIVFEEVPTLDASEDYKIYYPITQDMLSNDPELEQTDGYEQ